MGLEFGGKIENWREDRESAVTLNYWLGRSLIARGWLRMNGKSLECVGKVENGWKKVENQWERLRMGGKGGRMYGKG